MKLPLNVRNWWECSGDELWAKNLSRSNFVAQGDKSDRRGENQALKSVSGGCFCLKACNFIKKRLQTGVFP